MVKADAYGLGAVKATQALAAAGCRQFGTAYLEEAMELRENGIQAPILVLGSVPLHRIVRIATGHRRRQSSFLAPHRLSTPEHFAGAEGGFAKQRAHGLNTPLQRAGRGTDATPPSKGRHRAAQGQQRGETQEPPIEGDSHQLHLRPLFHGRLL